MVKVYIELSKLQIEMFVNCIDAAIDVKHLNQDEETIALEVRKQLSKYL